MKKRTTKLALMLALAVATLSADDWYKLTGVTRLSSNLYKADGGLVIETRMCLQLSLGEEALLKYERYGYDNKIVWPNENETCDVKGVYK